MLVSDAILPFKRYALHERGMRPKSYKSIIASLAMLTDWAGTAELTKLNHGIVKAFLYWGREERLWEARTFRNHRQYLKSFFDWALGQGHIQTNPIDGIMKPKLPSIIPRGLSRADLQVILNRARWYKWHYKTEGIRNETMLYVLSLTGLRLQEMLNLQLSDISLNSAQIMVRQGKGQKDRVVPIHPRLCPVIQGYLRAHNGSRHTDLPVFTGAKSEHPLQPRDVQLVCRKLSKDTGIKFTPHILRHTFGRLCVESGFSIYKIKEIMGHADITTTQRYLSASTENIHQSFGALSLI